MYEFEKIGVKVAVFRTLAPAFAWKRYRVRRRLAVASDAGSDSELRIRRVIEGVTARGAVSSL